ncbi:flavoprotein [Actinoplanes sp. GCM10030250]|uniref:flavoprotein n=1 Tax=Actinoplanes sp. GCM10030250 TaxID=3273376 RepID=UPI003618B11D
MSNWRKTPTGPYRSSPRRRHLTSSTCPALEEQTGRLVRHRYRLPGEPRSPRADAIIVAPATYNTINKFAHGISDTYALGLLAEAPGLGIPVVVLPFVNSALASREPFRRSVEQLRAERIRVLLGPGDLYRISQVPVAPT